MGCPTADEDDAFTDVTHLCAWKATHVVVVVRSDAASFHLELSEKISFVCVPRRRISFYVVLLLLQLSFLFLSRFWLEPFEQIGIEDAVMPDVSRFVIVAHDGASSPIVEHFLVVEKLFYVPFGEDIVVDLRVLSDNATELMPSDLPSVAMVIVDEYLSPIELLFPPSSANSQHDVLKAQFLLGAVSTTGHGPIVILVVIM